MKDILECLARQETLTEKQAAHAMQGIMSGTVEPVHIAAILMGLRSRGETIDELTGFTRAMRDHAIAVRCTDSHAIDLCGTGGDGSGTFNISTAAAFVCAGAGVTVAKHGNRSVSSKCGSADVLDALGIEIDLGPRGVEACLKHAGIAFLFARRFHPAMRHVAPVRRALGVRTCFNMLGPLCNPAGVQRQMVGAFSVHAAELMAGILARLGAVHVITLCSEDGLDEVSLGAPTHGFEVTSGGELRRITVQPEDYHIARAPLTALQGGTAEENARLLEALLSGKPGPHRDVTLLNAAMALRVSGQFADMDDCLATARKSIDSGAAALCLTRLRDASRTAP